MTSKNHRADNDLKKAVDISFQLMTIKSYHN